MKYALLLIVGVVCCTTLYGQGLQAGLRTGSSMWNYINPKLHTSSAGSTGDMQRFVWDKEVFGRYETKKKWAFEISINNNSYSDETSNGGLNYSYNEYTMRSTHSNYDITGSVQYKLTCPGHNRCPILNKLKSYIGIDGGIVINTAKYTFTDNTGKVYRSYVNSTNIMAGIHHYMAYSLGKKISAISLAAFNVNPDVLFSKLPTTDRDCKVSLRLGIVYAL